MLYTFRSAFLHLIIASSNMTLYPIWLWLLLMCLVLKYVLLESKIKQPVCCWYTEHGLWGCTAIQIILINRIITVIRIEIILIIIILLRPTTITTMPLSHHFSSLFTNNSNSTSLFVRYSLLLLDSGLTPATRWLLFILLQLICIFVCLFFLSHLLVVWKLRCCPIFVISTDVCATNTSNAWRWYFKRCSQNCNNA